MGEPQNGEQVADPLPQAMILTAIVISLAVSTFLFAMAYRNYRSTRDPEIEDELEPDEFADAEAGAGEEDDLTWLLPMSIILPIYRAALTLGGATGAEGVADHLGYLSRCSLPSN